LALRGGGHALLCGEVGGEGFELGDAHVAGAALLVVEDEALDLAQVGTLGVEALAAGAQGALHAPPEGGADVHGNR
jgi:hypothetical protein